jgi:hypothetical protein
MAEGNIALNFTSEMTDAARGLAELIKLEGEFDRSLQSVGKSGKNTGSILEQVSKNLTSMPQQFGAMFASVTAGFLSANAVIAAASAAVDGVKKSYQDLIRVQKEAGQAALESAKNIIAAAGLSNVGNLDAFKQQLQQKAGQAGVTVEEYGQIFAGYRTAAQAGQNETFAAASRIAALNDLVPDTAALAEQAGKIRHAMPGFQSGDALDLALMVRQKSRGRADAVSESMLQLEQMAAAGMDPKDAMAVVLGMVEKGYGTKQISAMGQILTDSISPTEKRPKTDKERIQNELAQIGSGKARMDWIAANPDKAKAFFGEAIYKLLPAMSSADFAAGQGFVADALSRDVAGDLLRQSGNSKAISMLEVQDAFTAGTEQSKLKNETDAASGLVRTQFDEYLRSNTNWFSRQWIQGSLAAKTALGQGTYFQNVESYLRDQDIRPEGSTEIIQALRNLDKTITGNTEAQKTLYGKLRELGDKARDPNAPWYMFVFE